VAAPIATASSNLKGQPDERHHNHPTVHGSPARTRSDVAVITRRNLLRTLRLPDVLVLSATMPVIFILMFTYVFGGAIQAALPPAAAGSYVNWLIPGLLAQFALFGGGATASGLVEDLAKGVIDRFRSLPMTRSAVLAGRTLSDLVRSALTLTLMLAAGFAIGFRPQTGFLSLLAALAVGLAFGWAWSWVMALLGLVVRTAEAVQAAVFMVVFPLAFTSSVFVPTQTMPTWLQPFAANQPITVVTNALRGLVLGQGALPPGRTVAGQVVLALLWAAAITAVFAPLAVRAYRRTIS
jgi:ABC transporter DrrB family efflux protein